MYNNITQLNALFFKRALTVTARLIRPFHVVRSPIRRLICPQIRPRAQLLMDLHWLRVPQCIQYKLCVLVHGCLNGAAPGYLSDLTVSVASAARRRLRSESTRPPIWWCHQLVAHPSHLSETVRSPWQVLERGTVYRQLSAQPPHRLLPLKKNLNRFCLDCHSVCDNVYCSLTMFSALAAVCTVDCAKEIVLITLHYITRLGRCHLESSSFWSTEVILARCPPRRHQSVTVGLEPTFTRFSPAPYWFTATPLTAVYDSVLFKQFDKEGGHGTFLAAACLQVGVGDKNGGQHTQRKLRERATYLEDEGADSAVWRVLASSCWGSPDRRASHTSSRRPRRGTAWQRSRR